MAPRRARQPQLAGAVPRSRVTHPALEQIDPGWTALFWAPRTVTVLVLGACCMHRLCTCCARALLGRVRTLLTPTTVAGNAGLSLLVYCSSLLAPPWGLQEAPECAKERGIYAALALYLGTPAFAPVAPGLRLTTLSCQATRLCTVRRRRLSGLTRRSGGFGTASAWRTCCFWRSCSFRRRQELAAS